MKKQSGLYLFTTLITLSLSLLAACGNSGIPDGSEVEIKRGTWYVLDSGIFKPVESVPPIDRTVRFIPWTVQQRVADLTLSGGRLFAAVNGYGIAGISMEGSTIHFDYYYEPESFRYRTITRICPVENGILCHFYFNTLLNIEEKAELALKTGNLLLISPRTATVRLRTEWVLPPFQVRNREWEIISFLPQEDNRYLLEWKYSDDYLTDFRYSLFNLKGNVEAALSRSDFRTAYGSEGIMLPTRQSEFLRLIIREMKKQQNPVDSYHLSIRSDNSPVIRRLKISQDPANRERTVRTIHLFEYTGGGEIDGLGQILYALLPDNEIIRFDPTNGDTDTIRLPELPEDFAYTNVFVTDGMLILSWEELDFVDVGLAGLLVMDDPFLKALL